jgi:hypothetical protein
MLRILAGSARSHGMLRILISGDAAIIDRLIQDAYDMANSFSFFPIKLLTIRL